jgi:monovalent cation/proton antiporter MnhG/PhaG subunit
LVLNASSIAVWILLGIGMASFLLTAAGILVRDVYERIHYANPGGTIGIAAIVAAILVHSSVSSMGIKAILTGFVAFWMTPVLSHAIGRAARVREQRRWMAKPEEEIEVVEKDKS